MKPFVFGLVIAVLLPTLACGKDQPKPPSDAPKAATPVPSDMVFNDFVPMTGGNGIVGVKTDGGTLEGGLADTPPAAPGADPAGAGAEEALPKLTVTEAGAEPRVARRYAFALGKTTRRLLTMRQSAGREGGGPMQENTFAITVDLTAKATKATATKFELKVVKVEIPNVPPAQKAQAQAQLAPMVGLAGVFDVTSHGDIGEVEFKADDKMAGPNAEGVLQALQQALVLAFVPFPVEPVGIGGKWQRKEERKERGEATAKTESFTLTEASSDGGVVTLDVDLSVPKRPFQQRGVPPGATVEVKGKGSYSFTYKLDQVSTKVDGEMQIAQRIELSDGKGPKQSVVENIKMKNQLETVGGAAPAAAKP